MMNQLNDKVCIITGAGTGIGKAIALAFAGQGGSIVLASRNRSLLDTAARSIAQAGGIARVVPTDVTSESQVVSLFQTVIAEFGRVDILVNNSGVFDGGPLDDIALAVWDRVIGVNLTGPFLCAREAMKIMKRQRGGRIINIGSISAQVPRDGMAPYTAAKHGLVGLTKSIALEGRPWGIAACCIHPGNVRTERRAAGHNPMDREPMMNPDQIAHIAVTIATLDPTVNLLESIVLPVDQLYLGRG